MKILLVDDSITIRKVALRTLYEFGYKKVYEASSGVEGLSILKKIKDIDLIIVDWEMPLMDGIEFIYKVREHDKQKNIKIVMATSKKSKDDVIKALKAGADHYIAKPFSDKTLGNYLMPIINSMEPSHNSENFIENFSNKEIKKFKIIDNKIQLTFDDAIVKIDIPLMVYHGAIQVQNTSTVDETVIDKAEE